MARRKVSTETDGQKDGRLWKKEIDLAGKREKPWRDAAEKVVKRYRGEEKKRNRFNVLWANTEILRPSIYNSRPNPDVRRRFRDSDPVGKAVAEILERSLSIVVDYDETDAAIKNDVLDGLLCGRGVSRVRYLPKFASMVSEPDDDEEVGERSTPPANDEDSAPEENDELESETAGVEHVDWRDFRHGYGRVWPEVPWVAFRHKLTRTDASDKFGDDQIKPIQFTVRNVEDEKHAEDASETQKVAEFWEVWDRDSNRVFFTQDSVDHLLFPVDNPEGTPPLDFDGFFPCPEPLRLVENTGSLKPIMIFSLYEEQANELDRISQRIDKIVNAMKLRGIYDSRLSEIADVLASDDNEMIPVKNAQQWSDAGLDKALSWMPTEKAAQILAALYDARDRQKAIIDELLGIADIIRGATDPQETATAQQLKSNYGSIRLQRMQKEVQRYTRDLLRLAARVMAQKFSPQTFAEMAELTFPTAQEHQALQAQVQLQQQRPMAAPTGAAQEPPTGSGAPQGTPPQGPQIDPALLQLPTWDEIMQVMRSPKLSQFKIDVETDSTVAGTLSSDMQGLSQLLEAISRTMQGLEPLVMSQALPVDAAKEIVLAVIRRARLGIVVEDAFDKMQAPKPPPGKHDTSLQEAQIDAQAKTQVEQIRQQGAQALQAQREQAENARLQFLETVKNQREQALEDQKTMREEMQSKLDASVKIIVAAIAAKTQEAVAEKAAERDVVAGLQ